MFLDFEEYFEIIFWKITVIRNDIFWRIKYNSENNWGHIYHILFARIPDELELGYISFYIFWGLFYINMSLLYFYF